MKKKSELLAVFDYSMYVAFVAATICMLVFQFVSAQICVTLALSFYVVAFGCAFGSLVIKAIDLFSAGDMVEKDHATSEVDKAEENKIEASGIQGEHVEVVHLKREKFWVVAGAVFCGLFAIFTLVVLVLL